MKKFCNRVMREKWKKFTFPISNLRGLEQIGGQGINHQKQKALSTTAKAAAAVLASAVLTGCATIMGESAPEAFNVRSAPDHATVVITDESGTKIFEGQTPTSLPLEKKKGFFTGKKYSLQVKKDGHAEQNITVDTKVNGWYLGNILFGGIIGLLIVDPATGAMWTLDTKEVDVTLEPVQQGAITDSKRLRVVLLKDIPLSLRDDMVKISR
jgi:hypothetical protein